MKQRKLGNSNLEVSAIGLGCMSMTAAYGSIVDKESMILVIRAAVERGITFANSSVYYE
jgi:aryl-alcohol dehydrogenase-like predicted oxidoreductase